MGKYYFRHGRMEKIRDDNFGFRCATPRSSKLMYEALRYEDQYFKDMTMQHKSIKEHYMCYMLDKEEKWLKTIYMHITLVFT